MKILVLVLCIIQMQGLAQKIEKEHRVNEEEVPEQAHHFMSHTPFTRIKWYKELTENDDKYEAKTKYKKKQYSIEFSNAGIIEDIEVKIKFNDLPVAIQSAINSYFQEQNQQTTFTRIQVQHVGNEEQLISWINQGNIKQLTINYELVAKVKTNNNAYRAEFLFSATGVLLSQKRISLHNNDLLDY